MHCRNSSDHEGFVNVVNVVTKEMKKIADSMALLELANVVLTSTALDKSRGNRCIDVGFASDLSTKRDDSDEWGGLAVPNPLKYSKSPIFIQALVGMSNMISHACPQEMVGKVFADLKRQRLFAGKLGPGNLIEALRVALTNENHLVLPHVDKHNCESEFFQGVINYSCWLQLSDGKWWRLSIIGYSRRSCAGALRRRDLYWPLVERIASFYESMPAERKVISSALLVDANSNEARHLPPHSNKCVFYSVYVDCLRRLQAKYNFSIWHLLAMLTNTVASESPDFFVAATKHYLSLTGKDEKCVGSLCYLDLAISFYDRIFDDKEKRQLAGTPTPGQRHQPHNNRRQPRSVLVKSIHNFFALYDACLLLDKKLSSDAHYFARAVGTLVQGCDVTGVYGAGPLTAQHLVHISVLCGCLPVQFIRQAEIGEKTGSYAYLARWEGLVDHQEDTRQLLACVCCRLGISSFVAENLVCKFGQAQVLQPPKPLPVPNKPEGLHSSRVNKRQRSGNGQEVGRQSNKNECLVWTKTKPSPYRDSVYPHQSLFDFDNDNNLVAITSTSERTVPTLASQCDVEPRPPTLTKQTFAFWGRKIRGTRLIPVKESTRNHVKFLKATHPAIYGQGEDAKDALPQMESAKKQRLRVLASKPSAKVTMSAIITPSKKRARRTREGAKISKAVIITPSKKRACRTREDTKISKAVIITPARRTKRAAAYAICDDSDLEDNGGGTDEGGSDDYYKLAQKPSLRLPDRLMLPLQDMAMAAIGFPRFQRKMLMIKRVSRPPPDGGREVMFVAASLSCSPSEGQGRHLPRFWRPVAASAGVEIPESFFPAPFIVEDGIRYHSTQSQAEFDCFMAAIHTGSKSRVSELLSTKKFRFQGPCVSLYYDRRCPGTTHAIIVRNLGGTWLFSFVDARGTCFGKSFPVVIT